MILEACWEGEDPALSATLPGHPWNGPFSLSRPDESESYKHIFFNK